MNFTIREEKADDDAGVRMVNEQAFGESLEARLVDSLRANDAVLVSLVAVAGEQIVGHILFSPVQLGSGVSVLEGAGLGPMSVLPDFQRLGIGSSLIEEGIRLIQQRGEPFVVVLGHPSYYLRFGFVPASRYGVNCQWDVPDDVFMILPLDTLRFGAASGLARYRDEFSTVT
ncbi:MAG TPA: N-acetyltransferase [Pyrinomonadaceae bacterium]